MDSYDPEFDPTFLQNILRTDVKPIFLESIRIDSDFENYELQLSLATEEASGTTAPIINKFIGSIVQADANLYLEYGGGSEAPFLTVKSLDRFLNLDLGFLILQNSKLNISTANLNETNVSTLQITINFIELD
jgi:hypothetical protein